MSISSVFFTNKGRVLQSKCMLGKTLNFTKIVIGDGELNGRVIQELETLISPKLEIPITKVITVDTAKVKIGGKFNNSNLSNGFYYRELGLFATDPDSKLETLYCYGNAANLAEYISSQGSEIIEKQIEIIAIVGNEASVTATINDSLLSISPEDLEAHDNDQNAHKPIRDWVQGLFNSLILTWDSIIGKPDIFPPSDHGHNTVTTSVAGFMSASDKTKLNGIAVNANNYIHPGSGTNPHGTTKSDVGLGSVQNYGVATTAQAQVGTADNVYMTPLKTMQEIQAWYGANKNKFGGDFLGKQMLYEHINTTVTSSAYQTVKSYSNASGGIAKILLSGISWNYTKFKLVIDGINVLEDVIVDNLFTSSTQSGSNKETAEPLIIPFNNSFVFSAIGASTAAHGIEFTILYYINQ